MTNFRIFASELRKDTFMKSEKIIYCLFCFFACLFFGCEKDNEEPFTERTVLVYVAGDNNLNPQSEANIQQMIRGMEGCSKGRLIVYRDQPSGGAKLIEIDPDRGAGIDDQLVIKSYGEENSASHEVLCRVIQETKEFAPAKSYGLILWSHGLGWLPQERNTLLSKSFGNDNNNEINLPELAASLEDHAFEFIIFDACLMGGVEVHYELRNKSRYIIASPHEVLAEGMPYDKIVPLLWGDESDLKDLCDAYYGFYNDNIDPMSRSATVALIRTDGLDALYAACSDILRARRETVASIGQDDVYHYYTTENVDRSYRNMFFDLDAFMEYLRDNKIISNQQYDTFARRLDAVVVHKRNTEKFLCQPVEKFCGMSVYIPRFEWTGLNKYYFGRVSWAGVYDNPM